MKLSKVASPGSAALLATGLMVWNLGMSAPVGTVEAIWRTQDLNFQFRASSVTYTCPGLKAKLTGILQSLGVQGSLAMSCVGSTPTRSIAIRLQTTNATEATAANVEAATQHDAKRRLLAHLRNESLPSAADIPRFDARWQRIDLHRLRHLQLSPGDCDLLHQMRKQLFPKLAIQVEQGGLECHASGATRITRPLRVLALLPEKRLESAASQVGQP